MTTTGEPAQATRGGLNRIDRLFARTHIPPAWRLPIIVYVWAQIVLLGWWAGDWPGLLSPDSISYVIHVTIGPWTADHSVVYDSAVLASLKLTDNVALLTLVQTIIASAIIAYCIASVHAFGVRARWAVIPGLVAPLIPSVGGFFTMVWKDVPFAFAEMLLAATTIRILVWRRSRYRKASTGRRLIIALGLELLAVTLFRNDGFLIIAFVAVVLMIALSGMRIKILAATLAALAGFAIATTLIYPAVGIKKAQSNLAYGTFYGDIAVAYDAAPRTFTAADRKLMTQVAPMRNWRKASNCYDSDTLFHKGFNFVEADRLKNQLAALWFKAAYRTPVLVTRTRLCRSAVAWDPLPPPADRSGFGMLPARVPDTHTTLYGYSKVLPHTISQNLQPDPLSTRLGRVAYHVRVASYSHEWVQVLMFRGASWCYLLYLALLVAALRLRRWNVLAIGAVSLATQLAVIAANPAQLYRYMVGPICVGILLAPLLAVRRRRAELTADGIPFPPVETDEDVATRSRHDLSIASSESAVPQA